MKNAKFPGLMGVWLGLMAETTRTALAANEVIWRRSAQMATGSMGLPEAVRMVSEKSTAAAQSAQSAALVAARGGSPLEMAEAAVKPYRRRTAANVKRLRR